MATTETKARLIGALAELAMTHIEYADDLLGVIRKVVDGEPSIRRACRKISASEPCDAASTSTLVEVTLELLGCDPAYHSTTWPVAMAIRAHVREDLHVRIRNRKTAILCASRTDAEKHIAQVEFELPIDVVRRIRGASRRLPREPFCFHLNIPDEFLRITPCPDTVDETVVAVDPFAMTREGTGANGSVDHSSW